MSAPRLNNAIPKISATAEQRKTPVSVGDNDRTGVKFKRTTIRVTGSTDTIDSVNFFQSAFNMGFLLNERGMYALSYYKVDHTLG